MDVIVTQVIVPFLDDLLALRLYAIKHMQGTENPAALPVIVMCNDFCGVQEMLLPDIAQFFAKNGFAVVTFDYRGFGHSTGERGRLITAHQQEDIRAVLNWIHQHPQLDEHSVSLWGTGLGGAHALCVAYRNAQVRCVVSQMPLLDGTALVSRGMTAEARKNLSQALQERARLQRIEGRELWVPISRLIRDRSSRQFYCQQRRACPAMVTRMPYLTLRELLHFRVAPYAAGVHQPTLMMISQYDDMIPMDQVNEVYEGLNGVKYLYRVAGAARYDLYRSPWREEVLSAQISWFNEHI